MKVFHWCLICLPLVVLLMLSGCDGTVIIDGESYDRDTAVTTGIGEAYLQYGYRSETVSVRDSSTDNPLEGIQVLGLADDDKSIYVVADPDIAYHPAITSGESSSYYNRRIYMTPVDQRLGTNATSYHRVEGSMLYRLMRGYGSLAHSTTVNGLRNQLASLAYGYTAGLVVCADQPLTSYSDRMTVTEVAQRSSNLPNAFQAIGWQYIYTNRGFSTGQSLNIWILDPYELGIAHGSSGALSNTFIAVVAPTSNSSGTVLPNSLRVELTWDAPVDLDLHLTRNGADLYDEYDDTFWKYVEQNWGDPYRVNDNPRLLFDDQGGYGPETIVLDEMSENDYYSVAVDYWGDSNGDPTNIRTDATVRVWTNGSSTPRTFSVEGFTYGAPESGQYKTVCRIDGDTGDVTLVDFPMTRHATRKAAGLQKK